MAVSGAIPADSFLWKRMTESQLSTFQADELEMDESYTVACNTAVDKIVTFLQHNVPWRVRKTIKVIFCSFCCRYDLYI